MALNEVRGSLFGQPSDQAHDLALAPGRAWLFMPTEHRFWHDDFGNGILTRLPVTNGPGCPCPPTAPPTATATSLGRRVDLGGQNVNVLVTHVNPLAIQADQIRMVSDLFCSLQEPALLLADFNADFKQPQVKALLETPGVHDCLAELPNVGRKSGRVDWVLARGMKTIRGDRIDNGALGPRPVLGRSGARPMTGSASHGRRDRPPKSGSRPDQPAPRIRLARAGLGTGRGAVLPAVALPPGGPPPPARLLGFVALFAATLLLPTLGGWRVLTRHEVLAAEPAREMLHGGKWLNWIIPQFGGEPRAVKPPTMGWLVAGSMALFHSEAEWVARLPSGLAAVLMAVLVADLASRWMGTARRG